MNSFWLLLFIIKFYSRINVFKLVIEKKKKKERKSDWVKNAVICNFIILSFMCDDKKSKARKKNSSLCEMDMAQNNNQSISTAYHQPHPRVIFKK